MLAGTRVFVFSVFSVIGLVFLSLIAVLLYEFGGPNPLSADADWLAIATLYSHLFLFFPTIGLFTLYAFYTPSCVFVDLYWRRVPYGRLRFLIGAAVLAALSYYIGVLLQQGTPAVWQIAPPVLQADRGVAESCGPYSPAASVECPSCNVTPPQTVTVCRSRQPLLKAVREVRTVSTQSIGLAPYGRSCALSPLLEPAAAQSALRYCFASGKLTEATSCCAAQQDFGAALSALYDNPANRSLTGLLHQYTLPVLTFYMLILVAIGALLIIRRDAVDEHYQPWISRLERGVILGALAMVVWPLSNHAFVETSAVLYGQGARSTYIELASFFSAVFGFWALMILFYFFRKSQKATEGIAKAFGVLISVLTVLNYSDVVSYSERLLGAGVGWEVLVVVAALLVVATGHIAMSRGNGGAEATPPAAP